MENISLKEIKNHVLENQKIISNRIIKPLEEKKNNNLDRISELKYILHRLKDIFNINKQILNSLYIVKANNCESFDVDVLNRAETGIYDIRVLDLAKNHTLSFITKNDKNKILGNKSEKRLIKFKQYCQKIKKYEEKIIHVSRENTKIYNLSNIINNANINIISEVKKISEDLLIFIIKSKNYGENSQITINIEGDSKLSKIMNFDIKKNNSKSKQKNEVIKQDIPATDAKILINGNIYYRPENIIKDVISNVNLIIKKQSNINEMLFLDFDKNTLKKLINQLVYNLNFFLSSKDYSFENTKLEQLYLNSRFDFNKLRENNKKIFMEIQKLITDFLNYKNFNFSLQSLGIYIDDNNLNLKLNEEILNDQLNKNLENIRTFFKGKGKKTGIIQYLSDNIKKYIDNNYGIITNEIYNLEYQNKNIKTQIENRNFIMKSRIRSEEKKIYTVEQNLKNIKSLEWQLSFIKNFKS